MGEAKRKTQQLEAWKAGLSDEEKTILSVAQALYQNFILPTQGSGMCYRMAFFLSYHLHEKYQIHAPAIIGYVNDGLGDIMASHAWIEYNGKKTDISLTITQHPDVMPAGALLLLDKEFTSGYVPYSYHYESTEAGLQAEYELSQEEPYRSVVVQKRAEHSMMQAINKSRDQQRIYLDRAPDGWNYERMSAIIENR